LNENGFSAEGDGPAGAVGRERPRGPVASINPADNVALSVVLDDVAQAKLVGVDLGHGWLSPVPGDSFQWCRAQRILTIDEFL